MKMQITVFKDGLALGAGTYQMDRVCIGSSETAHLRVDEEEVYGEHVEIYVDDGKCWVRALDGPLKVNDKEISDDRVIRGGDRVQVSESYHFTVEVTLSKEETQRVKRKRPTTMTFKSFSEISSSEHDALPDTDYSKPKPGAAPPPRRRRPPSDEEEEPKGFMMISGAGWAKVIVLGAILIGSLIYIAPILYKMTL